MRGFLVIGSLLLFFSGATVFGADEPHGKIIISPGKTVLKSTIRNHPTAVIVTRQILESEKPFYPSGYYRTQSVILNVELWSGGRKLFVPRSAFCDLFDPGWMTLSDESGHDVLTIRGADGAESYTVSLTFDRTRVLRRTLIPGEGDHIPTEDTKYRELILY